MTNSGTRLRVHPDLRFLVAPYSEQAHADLKAKLLQNGCSTPIRVWDNIVLVDYEAFEICKILFEKHGAFSQKIAEFVYTNSLLVTVLDSLDIYICTLTIKLY